VPPLPRPSRAKNKDRFHRARKMRSEVDPIVKTTKLEK
jgi:hypothetical protein